MKTTAFNGGIHNNDSVLCDSNCMVRLGDSNHSKSTANGKKSKKGKQKKILTPANSNTTQIFENSSSGASCSDHRYD